MLNVTLIFKRMLGDLCITHPTRIGQLSKGGMNQISLPPHPPPLCVIAVPPRNLPGAQTR